MYCSCLVNSARGAEQKKKKKIKNQKRRLLGCKRQSKQSLIILSHPNRLKKTPRPFACSKNLKESTNLFFYGRILLLIL